MPGTEITTGEMPEVLKNFDRKGAAPPPPPGSPPTQAAPSDDDEPEDQDLDDVQPEDLAHELGVPPEQIVGDLYLDAIEGIVYLKWGVEVEFPDERAARRGAQLALVLRKMGWEDEEILVYLGLVFGVGNDVVYIHRQLVEQGAVQAPAQGDQDAEDDPGDQAPDVRITPLSDDEDPQGGDPA